MSIAPKPETRPACPHFSSGPTAKRPGFSLDQLKDNAFGRSHRSALGQGQAESSDRQDARCTWVCQMITGSRLSRPPIRARSRCVFGQCLAADQRTFSPGKALAQIG